MNKKNIWTNVIIFAVIIVFINLISLSVFTRIDLSKGKIYSLSNASKTTVKNLEDRLIIKAYFSKNLPNQYADAKRYVEDILDEYQAYSKGNLRFEFIDPTDENELKVEAQKNMIQPVTMRVNENDQLVIREVYMGLTFLYQDKTDAIPFVQNTQGLEYDITSKIKKITSANMQKVAFFGEDVAPQNPRFPQPGKYDTVKQLIAESYELVPTTLEEDLIGISTLVFAGIEESLAPEQLKVLDDYVMSGGNVIFFQDKITANLQEQKADLITSNIFDLLSSYGIEIKDNLVVDANCGQIQVQRRQGIFNMNTPVNYPFLPIISNINKNNMIVKNIDLMQAIFVSEIDTLSSKMAFEPLFYSSDNSETAQMPNLDIGFNQYYQKDLRTMFLGGNKVIAGIFSGKIISYFSKDKFQETSNSEIIYVADSDFIINGGGAGSQGNLDFFINAVDYLSGQSSLIEIRSRETVYKPLKEISTSAQKILKNINILLPALLLILLGIYLYRKELKKRKHIGEIYE